MSRLDRDYVWLNHFGNKPKGVCPSCRTTIIHRCGGGDDWHKTHIIPHKSGGPDIYENIKPICRDCNSSKDRSYPTNYHYRVAIGTMLPCDLKPALAKIKLWQKRYSEDPSLRLCCTIYRDRKSGRDKRCKNAKIPGSHHCAIHRQEERRALTRFELAACKILKLAKLALTMDIFDSDEKAEFQQSITEAIEDLLKKREELGPIDGVKYL